VEFNEHGAPVHPRSHRGGLNRDRGLIGDGIYGRAFLRTIWCSKKLLNAAKLMGGHAVVAGEPYARLQPKRALAVRRADVHMWRLTPFVGVEMKPK
jgi:hypothetical protein